MTKVMTGVRVLEVATPAEEAQGIALALIEAGIEIGDHVVVDVRGRMLGSVVVKPPFVPSRVRE